MIPKKHSKPQSDLQKESNFTETKTGSEKNQFLQPSKRQSYQWHTERKPRVFIQAHTLWHRRAQAGRCTTQCILCRGTHLSPKSNRHTHTRCLKPAKHIPQLGHYFVPSNFWHFMSILSRPKYKEPAPCTTNLHCMAHQDTLTTSNPLNRHRGSISSQQNWTENWTENWKKEQTNMKTVKVLLSEVSRIDP